jgi:tRNA dimethylallyltransferase
LKRLLTNWKNFLAGSTNKCIFVVGPTASGKSAWALEQAEERGGSIINIDSVQFYKGLETGSAAPSEIDKKRVPHFLYSYVEAPKEMTAAGYIEDFYSLVNSGNAKFPLFIVGGTGFYIQALEKGMFDVEPVPERVREELEHELEEKGAEILHRELLQKDPHSKIHVNDHYRLVRALEIIRHTGKTPTELKAEPGKNLFPYPYIKIGFDFEKEIYRKRVVSRTKNMIASGIVEETKKFLDAGFSNWAPLQSVGFRETVSYLNEGRCVEWLQESIEQSTMQLIKKQKTWFRRDSSILWSNHESELAQFLS